MKVLVTGGAGFIGSHLVDKLIENGHEVIVLDNLSNGNKTNVNPAAHFFKIDIRDKKIVDIFRKEKPEVVFHLAAQINLRKSIENPEYDAEINILGSLNLLKCCVEYDVRKIVFSSSAAVYGEPQYLPVDEKHPTEPSSPYGVSKLSVEKYLKLFNETHGLDYIIFRYANVYGERQNPRGEAGVISIFIDKLLRGERPIIFGDGEQTRDYVYVKDVAEATINAMEKNVKNEIINIGTGKEITVNGLFKKIRELLKVDIEPIHEKPKKEVRRFFMNIEKAKKLLGWEPKTNLEKGLSNTIHYLKTLFSQ